MKSMRNENGSVSLVRDDEAAETAAKKAPTKKVAAKKPASKNFNAAATHIVTEAHDRHGLTYKAIAAHLAASMTVPTPKSVSKAKLIAWLSAAMADGKHPGSVAGPAKKATKKTAPPSSASVEDRLASMTKPDLIAVAKKLNVPHTSKSTVKALRESIKRSITRDQRRAAQNVLSDNSVPGSLSPAKAEKIQAKAQAAGVAAKEKTINTVHKAIDAVSTKPDAPTTSMPPKLKLHLASHVNLLKHAIDKLGEERPKGTPSPVETKAADALAELKEVVDKVQESKPSVQSRKQIIEDMMQVRKTLEAAKKDLKTKGEVKPSKAAARTKEVKNDNKSTDEPSHEWFWYDPVSIGIDVVDSFLRAILWSSHSSNKSAAPTPVPKDPAIPEFKPGGGDFGGAGATGSWNDSLTNSGLSADDAAKVVTDAAADGAVWQSIGDALSNIDLPSIDL